MIANGKIVAVTFEPGAGGKFIQNCLALSRHCLLKKQEWAEWDLKQTALNHKYYYRQKLQWALSTLPPTMTPPVNVDYPWWLSFELGDREFYSALFNPDELFDSNIDSNPIILGAAEHSRWLTYSAHSYDGALALEKYWPVVKHVYLSPAKEFAAKWLPIKNHILAADGDQHWGEYASPQGVAFYFDIDNTIYNQELFLSELRRLYEYLEWDDFDSAPIEKYYRAYIQLHI